MPHFSTAQTISGHGWVLQVKQRSSAVYIFLPRRATLNLGLADKKKQKTFVSRLCSGMFWVWLTLKEGQRGLKLKRSVLDGTYFPRGRRRLFSLVYGLRAFLLMLWIFWGIASMSLCCRNALNVSRVGKKKKKNMQWNFSALFFLFLPPPSTVAGDETCWAAGCISSLRSTACLTSSSVNSQNLNKNRRACGSAGAALKLQVSLFKTRLPSNISTLQLRRCALFPLSHRPEGCLHITRATLVKLVNVLRAH